jgi:intraflagellar transport protein 172
MAFTLLNHYLDLVDAIDEQRPDAVDYSDFDNTDIPREIPLPEKMYLSVRVRTCALV